MGQLGEDAFGAGDQTIEVKAVLLQGGYLLLSVLPEPAEGFVLEVDGTEFASADATLRRNGTLTGYLWTASELSWAEDDTVALSLSWVEAEDDPAGTELENLAKSPQAIAPDVPAKRHATGSELRQCQHWRRRGVLHMEPCRGSPE